MILKLCINNFTKFSKASIRSNKTFRLFATSCYGEDNANSSDKEDTAWGLNKVLEYCPYLPIKNTIIFNGDQVEVELSSFKGIDEYKQSFQLMNDVITEGKSWPFLNPYKDIYSFRQYFHSHASFAVTFTDKNKYGRDVLGCFYVKPNFPGRSSHICNGGFISNPKYRKLGIGEFMGTHFKRLAKDLGYRGSLFNLVYVSNVGSVKLWDKLGYKRICVIPGGALLKGDSDYVDAALYFCDFYENE